MDVSAIQPVLDELEEIESRLGRLRKRLAAMQATVGGEADSATKREDGRLTDVGIHAVNAAFDAGATVMEVARQLEITPSAASNRRKIWMSAKSNRS